MAFLNLIKNSRSSLFAAVNYLPMSLIPYYMNREPDFAKANTSTDELKAETQVPQDENMLPSFVS